MLVCARTHASGGEDLQNVFFILFTMLFYMPACASSFLLSPGVLPMPQVQRTSMLKIVHAQLEP